ncbi:hypothetical protein C2845_PM05G16410 [Panicum miliaceum]|uniref:Uncharacterized protein n=1 Tax=Panicum miliaceum TaxID=4540 RepID=A0A3L6SYU1_PANMI|nr:hypothetical protein C2845_PM05G16410 [Panicum miliaceum]
MSARIQSASAIAQRAGRTRNSHWPLPHLRDIEIRDCRLLDSHVRLLQLLVASAPILERMTVTLATNVFEDSEEEEDFDIPCFRGCWSPCVWECSELGFVRPTKYEWAPNVQRGDGA